MVYSPEKDFRWVHAIGGRDRAAKYLCGLDFGTKDIAQMRKRLSHWTGIATMGGNAVRAMANDRGIQPGDFDVLTQQEYAESLQVVAA